MPRCAISHNLKARIPVLFQKGYDVKEICDLLGVKKTLVYTTLSHHQLYGTPYNPYARQTGRPWLLQPPDIRFLQAILDRQQTVYVDELQEELYQARKIRVSTSTLLRTLQHLNFSSKVVSHKAIERDDLLHSAYMNQIADEVPDPNMFMFVDEAARNQWTSERKYGWSQCGERCIQRHFFVRGQRYSILPVLTLDRIITYNIIPGSVMAEQFLQFLWELVVCSTCVQSERRIDPFCNGRYLWQTHILAPAVYWY